VHCQWACHASACLLDHAHCPGAPGCLASADLSVPTPPGAHDIDEHFRTAPFQDNFPVLMGLLGIWNVSFLGYPARAVLPYTQALSKLAAHIQQVRARSRARRLQRIIEQPPQRLFWL
jgi:Phosphoglucose isomerase